MAKPESGHSTPDPDALLLPDDEELVLETEEESAKRQVIALRTKDVSNFLDYLKLAKEKDKKLVDRIEEAKESLKKDEGKEIEPSLEVIESTIKTRTKSLRRKDATEWRETDEKIFNYIYETIRTASKEIGSGLVLIEEEELAVLKKYFDVAKKKAEDIYEGDIKHLEKQFKILEDSFSARHVEKAPSASETGKGNETVVSPAEAGAKPVEAVPEENAVNPKTNKTPAEVAAQRKQKQEELLQKIKDSAEVEFQRGIAQGDYKTKEEFEKNTDTELAERLWLEKYNQAFSNLSEEKKNQLLDFGGEKYGVINETGVADLLAAGYKFDEIKSIKFAGRWSHKVKSKIVPGAVDEEDFRDKVAEIVKQKKEEMMGERWERNHRLEIDKKIVAAKENLRVEILGKMKDAWDEANGIDKALKSGTYKYTTMDGEVLNGEKALQDKKDRLSSRVVNIASQLSKENLMEKSAQEAGYEIGSKKDLAKQKDFRKNLTEHVRDVLIANGLIEKRPEPATAARREEIGDLDLTLDEEIDLSTSQEKDDEFLLTQKPAEQTSPEVAEDNWDDFFAFSETNKEQPQSQSAGDEEMSLTGDDVETLEKGIDDISQEFLDDFEQGKAYYRIETKIPYGETFKGRQEMHTYGEQYEIYDVHSQKWEENHKTRGAARLLVDGNRAVPICGNFSPDDPEDAIMFLSPVDKIEIKKEKVKQIKKTWFGLGRKEEVTESEHEEVSRATLEDIGYDRKESKEELWQLFISYANDNRPGFKDDRDKVTNITLYAKQAQVAELLTNIYNNPNNLWEFIRYIEPELIDLTLSDERIYGKTPKIVIYSEKERGNIKYDKPDAVVGR